MEEGCCCVLSGIYGDLWSGGKEFGKIVALNGEDTQELEEKKCATPTIAIVDGAVDVADIATIISEMAGHAREK